MRLFTASCLLQLATISSAAQPRCDENVRIPVSASAQNVDLPRNLNLTSMAIGDQDAFNDLVNLPTKQVGGDYTIAARYCEPRNADPARANTLQLLVHGIVYSRNYWSGLLPPGQSFNGSAYSWVEYASDEGYPTLSVDRLCSGASSKPDALLACQIPLNAEVLNVVVEAARAGRIGGRKFEKVVYVGHSLGSVIGNELARQHPDTVDAYILTGFTAKLAVGALGTVIAGGFAPAFLARPARFGTLLDPGYLFGVFTEGTRGLIYHVSYTESVFELDRQTEGTTTVGEFATALLGQSSAPKFRGPLMALNDQNDQIFCSRSPLDPLAGDRGDCGDGDASYTAQVRQLYPNAKAFAYANIAETGHSMNYHYTAKQTFQAAHNFLASNGF